MPPNLVVWQPDFANGWTLAGNPTAYIVAVKDMFGTLTSPAVDSNGNSIPKAFVSIWKWVNGSGWEFYSPLLSDEGNASYAKGMGMSVLSIINPGDGFWVNAIGSHMLPERIVEENANFSSNFFSRASGWNLVAPPRNVTGRELNQQMSLLPATSSSIPTTDITSIWTWEPWGKKWVFYAPVIDAVEDAAVTSDFVTSRNYYDMTWWNLRPGDGVWVNKKLPPVPTVRKG